VNLKIAGKWMFIPLKFYHNVSIGIDPYITSLARSWWCWLFAPSAPGQKARGVSCKRTGTNSSLQENFLWNLGYKSQAEGNVFRVLPIGTPHFSSYFSVHLTWRVHLGLGFHSKHGGCQIAILRGKTEDLWETTHIEAGTNRSDQPVPGLYDYHQSSINDSFNY